MGGADDEFVRRYGPLVEKTVERTRRRYGLTGELDDLMQLGFEGLLEARTEYEAQREEARRVRSLPSPPPFGRFAYYGVRWKVLNGVRKMGSLTRRQQERLRLEEGTDALTQPYSVEPKQPRSREDTVRAIDSVLGAVAAAYVVGASTDNADDERASPEKSASRAGRSACADGSRGERRCSTHQPGHGAETRGPVGRNGREEESAMTKAPYVKSVSHKDLRKLADRVLKVILRLAHVDGALAVLGPPLAISAQAFIDAYDETRKLEGTQGAEMAQSRTAVQHLYARLRVWVATLSYDLPSFDSSLLDGTPEQPEHLRADAKRIVEMVQAAGGSLGYAEQLVTELSAAAEHAEAEWTDARAAMVKLQELRNATRAAAVELHRRLVAFRRTLRVVVGSSHLDYQTLRASRVRGDVEVEEELEVEVEVEETETTTPAPTNGHATEAVQASADA